MDDNQTHLIALSILCQGYLAVWDPSWLGETKKDVYFDTIAKAQTEVQKLDWWNGVFPDVSTEQALHLFGRVGPRTSRLVQIVFGESGDAADIDCRLVSDCHVEIHRKILGNNPEFLVAIRNVNKDLIEQLMRNPEDLYQLPPRRFEELVAEILLDMGYEVELTPQTRDGGRDILAAMNLPIGNILTIVECKRFSMDRPVGIDVVERFLYTIRDKDRASSGLIVATSRFSSCAIALAQEHNYQLKLKDFDGLKEWVAKYGTWHTDRDGELWIPKPNH